MSGDGGPAVGVGKPSRRRFRVTLGRAVLILATAVASVAIAGRDLRAIAVAAGMWLFLVPCILLLKSSLEALAYALIWLALIWFFAPAVSGRPPGFPPPGTARPADR